MTVMFLPISPSPPSGKILSKRGCLFEFLRFSKLIHLVLATRQRSSLSYKIDQIEQIELRAMLKHVSRR
jgi:hypothetical protein